MYLERKQLANIIKAKQKQTALRDGIYDQLLGEGSFKNIY
jgi:hypothetical protein